MLLRWFYIGFLHIRQPIIKLRSRIDRMKMETIIGVKEYNASSC